MWCDAGDGIDVISIFSYSINALFAQLTVLPEEELQRLSGMCRGLVARHRLARGNFTALRFWPYNFALDPHTAVQMALSLARSSDHWVLLEHQDVRLIIKLGASVVDLEQAFYVLQSVS